MTQTTAEVRSQERDPARRPDIQGLRALAVILVIVFHARLPLPGGFVGVDVFFVISGFVITALLLREFDAQGRIRLGRFYLRRFRRLAPALALVIVFTVVASVFVLSPTGTVQRAAETGIGATLISGNLVIALTTGGYFDDPASSNPLVHTWSLAVEEQFYVVFPLLLLVSLAVGRALHGGRRVAAFVVIAVGAVSFGLSALALVDLTPPVPGGWFLVNFYSPATRAWEFSAGALLALGSPAIQRALRGGLAQGAGIVGGLGIVASAFVISKGPDFPGVVALLPVVSTVLLIAAGASTDSVVSRFLSISPFERIGDWSYSLYLWHWPFIVLATALWPGMQAVPVIAAVVSVVPALLSYYFLENPIRRAHGMGLRGFVILGVVVIVVPLVVSGGVRSLANSVNESLGLSSLDEWVGITEGCHRRPSEGSSPPDYSREWARECVWNADGAGPPIYLMGDSNALHFSDAVVGAGESLDRPVYSVTGCSPVRGMGGEICKPYQDLVYSWLGGEVSPGTVILSALDTWSFDESSLFASDGRESGPTRQDKISLYGELLTESIGVLKGAGHHVVIVQTVPTFAEPPPAWEISQCSMFDLTGGTCGRELPLSVISGLQDPLRREILRISEETGAQVVDLRSEYCVEEVCTPEPRGRLAYKDSTHISHNESLRLIPRFVEELIRSEN